MDKINITFHAQYDLNTTVATMIPQDLHSHFIIRVSFKQNDFDEMSREHILEYCHLMYRGIIRYAIDKDMFHS